MIFIIGTIIFAVGSGLDIWTSYLCRTVGSTEGNPLQRNSKHQFVWQTGLALTGVLYAGFLFAQLYWGSYQVGVSLILIGAFRIAVALGNNYPQYLKFRKVQ